MQAPGGEIAFLHLGQTHDDFPDVAAALGELNIGCRLVHLRECDGIDWSRIRGGNLRQCRGYHLQADFRDRLQALHARIAPLEFTNSLAVIQGSLDKADYLPLLDTAKIGIVPSYWPGPRGLSPLEITVAATGWDDFVVKPKVASKSWKTVRVRLDPAGVSLWLGGTPQPAHYGSREVAAGDLARDFAGEPWFAQRYIPTIETLGERSFVFLGGRFNHAVHKRPAAGHWLAHEFYGGHNRVCSAAVGDIRWAEKVHEVLVDRLGPLQYARIDALSENGRPLLLECELVVPRLFLREAGAVGRYAEIVGQYCGTLS